jgi:hypothetical protein
MPRPPEYIVEIQELFGKLQDLLLQDVRNEMKTLQWELHSAVQNEMRHGQENVKRLQQSALSEHRKLITSVLSQTCKDVSAEDLNAMCTELPAEEAEVQVQIRPDPPKPIAQVVAPPPDIAVQIMQSEIQNSENVDNKEGADTSHQDAVLLYGRGATWITQQDTEGGLVAVDRRALFNANSICYRICETQLFHVSSLMMICINAIYIGVEADANDAKILSDAPIGFQVMEHVFCVFFVFELAVRYGAFVRTSACMKDRWFMFDFFLVVLMVIDTWIFGVVLSFLDDPPRTGAVGGIGRMFRLLRLTRISKLMHTIPELVTMAKGMVAAVRAVHAALLILVILVYVFAIIINAVIGEDQDLSEYLAENFSTVRDAMITLTLQGVLMDDINTLYRELISYGNIISIIVFGIFVLLSAITVMNMLIGVLCQVVLDVSEAETEDHVKAEMSKTLLVMLENLDDDGSGELSKKELQDVIAEPEAIKILNEIQVDTQHLLDIFEMLYTNEGTTLPIHVILNIVLMLRGRRSVTMDDFAKGYNFILWALEAEMKKNTETVTTKLEETLAAVQDKKRT